MASHHGRGDLARFLVKHDADVTTTDMTESTLRIGHDANLTAQNRDRRTPLHHALTQGNVILVWFLIEHGTNATTHDKDSLTPLHHASGRRSVDLVQYLTGHEPMLEPEINMGRLRCMMHRYPLGGIHF